MAQIPTQGIYDDRDPRVIYSGSGWGSNSSSQRYASTQSFSQLAGDSASFTFSGTQVSYVYAKQGNLGNFTITIDGVPKTPPAVYSSASYEIGEQVATYSGLTNSVHTITIQALGTPLPNSSAANVVIDAFIVGDVGAFDGVYDDRSPLITYQGLGWTSSSSNPSRYQRTQTFAYQPGNIASFKFTGTQVNYVYCKQRNLGFVRITIDDVLQPQIDGYSLNWNEDEKRIATYPGLSNATHTIAVEITGTSRAEAVGTYGVIDAFVVGQAGALDGVYDNADSRLLYSGGGWSHTTPVSKRYLATQSYAYQSGNSVSFTFTGTQVGYVYVRQTNLGFADISIDGGLAVSYFDEYGPEWTGPQILLIRNLTNRTHTITVRTIGQKSAASSAPYIVVDAFTLNNAVPPATSLPGDPPPPPTYGAQQIREYIHWNGRPVAIETTRP